MPPSRHHHHHRPPPPKPTSRGDTAFAIVFGVIVVVIALIAALVKGLMVYRAARPEKYWCPDATGRRRFVKGTPPLLTCPESTRLQVAAHPELLV